MAEIKEKERKNNKKKQERREYTGYLNCCFKYEKSVKAKVLSLFGGEGDVWLVEATALQWVAKKKKKLTSRKRGKKKSIKGQRYSETESKSCTSLYMIVCVCVCVFCFLIVNLNSKQST